MSGAAPDPLDRIEEEAVPYTMYVGYVRKHELMALVEVARAARYLIELRKHDRGRYYERTAWKDLDAALSRLDTGGLIDGADDGAA